MTMNGTRVYLGRLARGARERDIEKFFKGYGKIREIIVKEGYGFIEFDEARDADDAVYDLNGKELLGDRVIVEHAKPPGSRRESGGRDGRMSGGRSGFGGGGGYGGDRGYGGRGGGGYGGGRFGGGGGGYDRGAPMRPRNPPPLRTDYRVRVENLSSKVSWQDLKDYMRQAGEVTYADAHKIRQNEGVVEFACKVDMEAALSKLDGTDLSGRKIKLSEDKQNGSRSRKRSHSRSDSRDHSKSRSRSHSKNRRSNHRSSRSHSKSRSKSRSKSHEKSVHHSRSRSPIAKKSSRSPHSRSRSVSKGEAPPMSRSRSRSRSRSSSHGKGN